MCLLFKNCHRNNSMSRLYIQCIYMLEVKIFLLTVEIINDNKPVVKL